MSDYEHIKLSTINRVGWLEFARPPINAFDWDMVREVQRGIEEHLADREVRVIVMASALDRFFSTGADLDVFSGMAAAEMAEWVVMAHNLVKTLRQSEKPLLAAIHGTAVGGGLEMTLHCDLRFAATDARLGQPEININLIPPVGATQARTRLIGRPNAIKLLYDGTLISAIEALEIVWWIAWWHLKAFGMKFRRMVKNWRQSHLRHWRRSVKALPWAAALISTTAWPWKRI